MASTAEGGGTNKRRKTYTLSNKREAWTEEEHSRFLEAVRLFNRNWKRIEQHVATKTVIQIRSHAQKYFQKAVKAGDSALVPPPRPKRKSGDGRAPRSRKGARAAQSAADAGSGICQEMASGIVTSGSGDTTSQHRTQGANAANSRRSAAAAASTLHCGDDRLVPVADGTVRSSSGSFGVRTPNDSSEDALRVPTASGDHSNGGGSNSCGAAGAGQALPDTGAPAHFPSMHTNLACGLQGSSLNLAGMAPNASAGPGPVPLEYQQQQGLPSAYYPAPLFSSICLGPHSACPNYGLIHAFLGSLFDPVCADVDHEDVLAQMSAVDRHTAVSFMQNLMTNLQQAGPWRHQLSCLHQDILASQAAAA